MFGSSLFHTSLETLKIPGVFNKYSDKRYTLDLNPGRCIPFGRLQRRRLDAALMTVAARLRHIAGSKGGTKTVLEPRPTQRI